MFNTVSFYAIWLTLVGCLIAAAPAAGIAALIGALAIALKTRR